MVQAAEICDNGVDDDADGLVDSQDDDCPTSDEEQQKQSDEEQQKQQQPAEEQQQTAGQEQQQTAGQEQQQTAGQEQQQTAGQEELTVQEVCGNNTDDDGDGAVDENCATSTLTEQEQPKADELCGNDIDDNLDGQVDENCTQTQNSLVQQVPSEGNSTPALPLEQVPATVNKCSYNDTSCNPSAEPKMIPPVVNECSDNQSGCTPSAEPKMIPPIVNHCQVNDTSCNPSAEAKLIPPVTEPCANNESGCFGVEPKEPLSTSTQCENNLTECASEIEPQKSVEPIADISNCPNNMTITHCLPPADIPIGDFANNTAPVAVAGEDQEVDENSLVTLDGTKSHDDDGNITSYAWVQTGGNESVTISQADSPRPSFYVSNVASAQTLTFELTVFDNMGYATSDDVDVFVKNTDNSTPIPLNGSISLDRIPKTLDEGTIYDFKGQLNVDNASGYEGRYVQILDSSSDSSDILAFGPLDRNGVFNAEWTAQTSNTSYSIYARYDDDKGSLESETHEVSVLPVSDITENITYNPVVGPYDNIVNGPYIDLRFNNYKTNTLNVCVVYDKESSKYVPYTREAIDHWSKVLKATSGNYRAWNFKISVAGDFCKSQFALYPINILVNLNHDFAQKKCNDEGGHAEIGLRYRLFKSSISTQVFTGCGINNWTNKEVFRITSHEFGHALGLGHTWHEKDDMMCSTDYLQRDLVQRLFLVSGIGGFEKIDDSCEGGYNLYPDDSYQPSELDIRSILYLYGKDGFESPNNRLLIPGMNDYYACREPCTLPSSLKIKFAELPHTAAQLPRESEPPVVPKIYSPPESFSAPKIEQTNKKTTTPYKSEGTLSLSQKKETTNPYTTESIYSPFQPYRYNMLGISLKHPPDWKFAGLKNGFQLIKEPSVTYIEIRKSNSQAPNTTLEQLANHDIQERFSTRKDFRLLNLSQTTISGNLPAYKAVYEFLKTQNQKDFTNAGDSNKVLRITTVAHGDAYIIKYVSEKNKFDSYLPIAEKIIDSLDFNGQDIKKQSKSTTGFADSTSNNSQVMANKLSAGKNLGNKLVQFPEVIYNQSSRFSANLVGEAEVPPIFSESHGSALLVNNHDGTITYKINATALNNVTGVNLYRGNGIQNGDILVRLIKSPGPAGILNGNLVEGKIRQSDILLPSSIAGNLSSTALYASHVNKLSSLIDLMNHNMTYVNILTSKFPQGELRGQVITTAFKEDFGNCIDNGKIPPCVTGDGKLALYCDDPSFKNDIGTLCMPSPADWKRYLPDCSFVDTKQSCTRWGQILWRCDDPEFNFKKYPQGCMNVDDNVRPTSHSNNNHNDNHKSSGNRNSNNKHNNNDVVYACRFAEAKIVESNKDLPVCKEKRFPNNNDNDNHDKKKIDNSKNMICDSDPDTTAPSCDDFDSSNNANEVSFNATMLVNNHNKSHNDNNDFKIVGNLSRIR